MQNIPGEIAYTNIITSSVVSLIPQIVGFLASKKFHYTSFFINNTSNFTFVYCQESTLADDIILVKRACEAELREYRIEMRYYHADNGIYAVEQYKAKIENKK